MDVPKWCMETADHSHYQTTEDWDEGAEQQEVDGDDDEYQEAS